MSHGSKNGLIGWAVSAVVSVPFLASSFMKLLQLDAVKQGMVHLGIPDRLIIPLGILELTCVILYLIPRTCFIGAILLTGYIGGAIMTHLRLMEPVFVQITIGVLIWGGLFLRFEKLRSLIPIVRK